MSGTKVEITVKGVATKLDPKAVYVVTIDPQWADIMPDISEALGELGVSEHVVLAIPDRAINFTEKKEK